MRSDNRQSSAESPLAVHERIALAALIAAVTLWIRVVEFLPDSRRRADRVQSRR
jgi:hypothetical protein